MNKKSATFRSSFSVFFTIVRPVGRVLRSIAKQLFDCAGQALPEFVLSFGMLPACTKDPDIEAWQELKRRHARRRKSLQRPAAEPCKILPFSGSVDDPFFRITM